MTVHALTLPPVGIEDATARRLLGIGVSLPFEVAGETGLLELTPGGAAGGAPCVLACAHGVFTLDEPGAVLSLFGECPVVLPADPGPDDAWFWSLFQQTLSEPLRLAFGFLKPTAEPAVPGIVCRLDVRVGAARVTSHLQMPGTTLLGLLRAAPWQRRSAPGFAGFALHVPLELGRLALPAGQLATLRPGDVLVPETALFDSSGQGLIRLGRHCLQVRVHSRAAPLRLTLLALEETVMSTTADTDILTPDWDDTARYEPEAQAPEAADQPAYGVAETEEAPMTEPVAADLPERFDDLPLALTIRCGHLNLTLGELRNLAPGAVLQVQGATPGTAALFYGERALAHGELVEVDGRLGLQIARVDVAG
ncbi:type III secretion system cytoplasmic ring protein SctQ [Pseudomonas beijingensis]|uniref:Type III secretion system cytoplasmic ring protein SctQ n=1 Tax=Pseudomonas beijingensis TaxID=2954101 RepID=A0ABY9FC51_9PSED|nr:MULTISPECIES: type III secretion system cytoplasmic ring protein SctQ [unclassified Pseudomonas]WLH00983.1 type III secretion system cytoplasmic ring protein SctQ [Pseudomonas sp. FP2034]WLH46036.1 type III secretion system cytoplasmic ring protein SctQ [Pseudomonas sp. FP2262]WLI45102.1 type III secretion system cytoplasmic ring protein SctQ [Pseudomonas sp. FP830]